MIIAGPIVHRLSPTGMQVSSAVLSALLYVNDRRRGGYKVEHISDP